MRLDAWLFDLDGVLTDTVPLHVAAWARTFDDFLRAEGSAPRFAPFDPVADYDRYVDGMPRYDGVRRFLASRGIRLPEGTPDDPADRRTVCGLGNRKNAVFLDLLRERGVQPAPGARELVTTLRAEGARRAVVSSSANCDAVLDAAGIHDLFDAVVDGRTAARLRLAGKPAPDTFLEAARELAVQPARAAVVEDALAGVEAGRAGGFGLVVGVARGHDDAALRAHGAGLVVTDLLTLLDPTLRRPA